METVTQSATPTSCFEMSRPDALLPTTNTFCLFVSADAGVQEMVTDLILEVASVPESL